MELSLSPSSSVGLSAICPRQSLFSYCRTKIKIKVAGRSSAILAKSSQILPSIEFHRHKSCPKLFTPSENNRGNAIRALDSTQAEAYGPDSGIEKVKNFLDVFWIFVRPHVILGTLTGFIVILARTWIEHSHPLKWSQLLKASAGLVVLLCADGYANCINQIFDVEIDKINKPYLPIPSGALSLESAWLLVTSFVAIGVSIAGALNSAPFACFAHALFFLGSVYSVPPISMKRSTVGAILVIALAQGILPLASFAAARASLGLPFVMSFPVAFITIFKISYASVIAICKDLSDTIGDRKFKVPTLATIIGVRSVAFIGSGLILLNYIGAILASIYMPQIFRRSVLIPTHTILALILIYQLWKLDRVNYKKEESEVFYHFIWKLLYTEFALFPFI